ncbi:hypothetical protein INR49_020343 [Caranx melampygus]|nr:hypothetical protein INR49_020343 [Caranx melampygus]
MKVHVSSSLLHILLQHSTPLPPFLPPPPGLDFLKQGVLLNEDNLLFFPVERSSEDSLRLPRTETKTPGGLICGVWIRPDLKPEPRPAGTFSQDLPHLSHRGQRGEYSEWNYSTTVL